jgi:hypothetical protein
MMFFHADFASFMYFSEIELCLKCKEGKTTTIVYRDWRMKSGSHGLTAAVF